MTIAVTGTIYVGAPPNTRSPGRQPSNLSGTWSGAPSGCAGFPDTLAWRIRRRITPGLYLGRGRPR